MFFGHFSSPLIVPEFFLQIKFRTFSIFSNGPKKSAIKNFKQFYQNEFIQVNQTPFIDSKVIVSTQLSDTVEYFSLTRKDQFCNS